MRSKSVDSTPETYPDSNYLSTQPSLKHSIYLILMILGSVLFAAPQAIAQSIEDYCLTRISPVQFAELEQQPKKSRPHNTHQQRQQELNTILIEGTPYYIEAEYDSLHLKEQGKSESLATVQVPQEEAFYVEKLLLSSNSWLWVDGRDIDYTVPLNLDGSIPVLGEPSPFPELYDKPCSWWGQIMGCVRSHTAEYSASLDRVFFSGYPPSFWGRTLRQSFEVSASGIVRLPGELHNASVPEDVLSPRGVVFQGADKEALFYDGEIVTTLIPPLEKSTLSNRSPGWSLSQTATKRTFVVNVRQPSTNIPPFVTSFVAEMMEGPKLKEFAVSDEVPKIGVTFIQQTQDSPTWFIAEHYVSVEKDQVLETVIRVPKPYRIWNVVNVEYAPNGTIILPILDTRIVDYDPTALPKYYITPVTVTAQCEFPLRLDKPVILDTL